MAKYLIILGVLSIGAGLLIHLYGRIPFLGRLPGDIRIERENYRLYVPLTSALLVSVLLSVLLYLFNRFRG